MNIQLEYCTSQPEIRIAKAAGISHDNKIETISEARKLIKKLVERGHYSPLEFSDATFFVSGVSRSFLAQITRHRHASFMVKSQRFTSAENEDTIIPESVHETFDKAYVFDAYYDYKIEKNRLISTLKEEGVPKEDYRFFLPIGIATEMYIKANFREWKHIIDLRGSEDAQWEIRKFAHEVENKLADKAPSIFID